MFYSVLCVAYERFGENIPATENTMEICHPKITGASQTHIHRFKKLQVSV